jgi:hypothetical protein
MVRSVLAAAGVLAIISTGALADPMDGTTTTKIIRSNPDGTTHRTVVHRHVNRYGDLVTHKKTVNEGMSGSTITHSRTTTDPAAGGSSTTIIRKSINN